MADKILFYSKLDKYYEDKTQKVVYRQEEIMGMISELRNAKGKKYVALCYLNKL